MSEKVYRLGVVGVGRWGKNFIKTINGMSGVEVSAICTRDPSNSKLCKNKPHVYTDYTEMILGLTNVDGFVVCMPPKLHFPVMDTCIKALKPFIIEKPMCMSLAQTTEICSHINDAKLPVLVDYTQLFNPAYLEVLNAIYKQKINHIVSKVRSFGPFRKDVSMLWDWLPHDLSMIFRSTREEPISLKATYEQDPNYDNAGIIKVDIKFKTHKANIDIDNTAGQKFRVFSIDGQNSTTTMMDNEVFEVRDKNVRPLTVSKDLPLKNVVDMFLLCMEEGKSFGLDISLNVARTIEKVEESIKIKKEVKIT